MHLTQSSTHSRGWLVTSIVVAVILIDQILKIWVKTHFYLGEELTITSWFKLLFIENNGMAFGMELGSKLFLTLFRLCLIGALIWYILKIRKATCVRTGYIVCLSLILAGAIGNIVDCVFYGLIFNNPMPPEIAIMFPDGGGYGTAFHGLVVDMLYFPLFSFTWPEWIPVVGGEVFEFFKPIFNFADAAITVGILVLLIFFHKDIVSPEKIERQCSPQEGENAAESGK